MPLLSLVGKSDVEVREAIGDKFPKHIYHSIVCIGARAIRPAAPPPAEKPIACQDEVRQSTGNGTRQGAEARAGRKSTIW